MIMYIYIIYIYNQWILNWSDYYYEILYFSFKVIRLNGPPQETDVKIFIPPVPPEAPQPDIRFDSFHFGVPPLRTQVRMAAILKITLYTGRYANKVANASKPHQHKVVRTSQSNNLALLKWPITEHVDFCAPFHGGNRIRVRFDWQVISKV